MIGGEGQGGGNDGGGKAQVVQQGPGIQVMGRHGEKADRGEMGGYQQRRQR